MRPLLRACLFASLLALAGCSRPSIVEPGTVPVPSIPAPELAGAHLYEIDSASRVHVLVFRGGPMARLGHNHVMTVQNMHGRVWVQPQSLARSGFELKFAVADMVVDEREARRAVGRDDFPSDIPEKDRAGTRANMLRTEVLDAAGHPFIELRTIRIEGGLPQPTFVVAVTLKDVTREVQVPANVAITADRVQARGEFAIKQTDFGITPFRVAMGAVQVQDELKIRFEIAATRTAA